MISVLLTLLKIIGIVLLVLLGLLLVILLVVLFVPVRYRLNGYYKDEFVCYLKATWLLHLVSFSMNFEKGIITSLKILGMDVSSLLTKKDNSDTTPPKANKKGSQNIQPDYADSTSEPSDKKESIEQNNPTFIETVTECDIISNAKSDDSSRTNDSIFNKIKNYIANLQNKLLSVRNKIYEFIEKIKKILINIKNKKESLERYIQILKREEVKGAFSLCKKRIFKLIRHILPKKMKVNAHIGMEDPSTTGYIVAFYSVLPEKMRRQIQLQAEYNKQILECDFSMKGSCNAIRFLHEIIWIVSDKNCRTFYQLVKKEISNE